MVQALLAFIVFLIFALTGLGLSMVSSAGAFLIFLGAILYDAIMGAFVIPLNTVNMLFVLAILAELAGFIIKRLTAKKRETFGRIIALKIEESALVTARFTKVIILFPLLILFGTKRDRKNLWNAAAGSIEHVKKTWLSLPHEFFALAKKSMKLHALIIIMKSLVALAQIFLVFRIILTSSL